MGDSISSGVGDGMASLDRLGGSLDKTSSAFSAVGNAGAAAGSKVGSAMDGAASSAGMLDKALTDAQAGADNLAKVGESTGGRVRKAFDNAATASDNMGVSFAKNFSKAEVSGKGFASSIKIGVVGAFDTAKKRAGAFVKDTVGGVKKVGDAFLHPVRTIKGKFSGAMKDAAGDTVKIGDKAKKSGKNLGDMGDSGAKAGDKLQKSLGAVLKVLAVIAATAIVVTGITKFVGAALEANKAAENISHSFDKTFGDSAADVEGWANNFSSAVHRSTSEVKSFLTSNRQLYESMGVTGQAADDLSKATTSLAFDIGNKFGIKDSEALSQLQDAISGNADALKDYGVRLDDTTLKASAMAMGLGSNLDKLDDATMAQVRFNAIMEQTGDIQQNASQSLGGLTGGMKAINAIWTDFLEKAGAKLEPTFDKLFGVVLDAWPKVEPALMSFADLLAGGFEQAAPAIADLATDLLPQLMGLVGSLLPMLMEVGGDLLPIISQVLGTVVQAIGPLLPLLGNLIKTLLPPLAQLFGTLVNTLLPPLVNLIGSLAPVIDALSPVLEIVAGAIGLVADAIAGLIGWLTKGIEKVGEFASGLKDSAVGQFVGGAISSVRNFIGGNAKGTDNFEGGWTHIHEAGDEMIQAKHSGGMAYLPKGSAVIPASKTEQILSGDNGKGSNVINITNMLQMNKPVQPGWNPVLIEHDPLGTPKDDTPDGDGNPKEPPPPPPPPDTGGGTPDLPLLPDPVAGEAAKEVIIRKVIEVHVTSDNGALSQEAVEQIKQMIQYETKQANDDELDALAIQFGISS